MTQNEQSSLEPQPQTGKPEIPDSEKLSRLDFDITSLRSNEQLENAEAVFRLLLLQRESSLGETHSDTCLTMHQLAETLTARGNHVDAYKTLGDLRGRLERSLGHNDEKVLRVDENILRTLLRLEKYEEVKVQSQKLIEVATETHGCEGYLTVCAMNYLACAIINQGRLEEAIGMFRLTFEITEKHPEISYPDYIDLHPFLRTRVISRAPKRCMKVRCYGGRRKTDQPIRTLLPQ
ncbi:hypothetical protein EDB80DRAFT_874885 [Ilyonectria destructans]|nr:hypothetical protein EDB80DRAFT_874885 [Ilyonectria destructans]